MASNPMTRFAIGAFKLFCSVVILFSLVFTIYAAGPAIETSYWPVVSKLEITSIEPAAGGKTKIRVAFRKLRDCDYLGISWFVGDRLSNFERVSVELMRDPSDTSSPNRPLGYQHAGPWIVGISPDELKSHSFTQLQHRCHPFWNSITDFYP